MTEQPSKEQTEVTPENNNTSEVVKKKTVSETPPKSQASNENTKPEATSPKLEGQAEQPSETGMKPDAAQNPESAPVQNIPGNGSDQSAAVTPQSQETSDAPEVSANPEETPRPGCFARIRKWLFRLFLLVIFLIVVARIALPYAIPQVLPGILEKYDLKAEYSSLEMSTLFNYIELKDLNVKSLDGEKQYVSLERFTFHLKLGPLASKKIFLKQLDIQGLEVVIDREKDGQLELVKRLLAAIEKNKAEDEEEPEEEEPEEEEEEPEEPNATPWRLLTNAPVAIVIESLRIERLSVKFRDESVKPSFSSELKLDFKINDFAVPNRDHVSHIDLVFTFKPVIEKFEFHAATTLNGEDNNLLWTLNIDKVDADQTKPYLHGLISNEDKPISLTTSGSVKTNTALGFKDSLAANIRLNKLRVKSGDRVTVALDLIDLHVTKLNLEELLVKELTIDGIRAKAKKTPLGDIKVAGIILSPRLAELNKPAPKSEAEDSKTDEKEPKDKEEKEPEASEKEEQKDGEEDQKFRLKLDVLTISNIDAAFDDASTEPKTALALMSRKIEVSELVIDKDDADHALNFDIQCSAPGIVKSVSVKGSAAPFSKVISANLALRLNGIKPTALNAHLAKAGIQSEFKSGSFKADIGASIELGADQLIANLTLDQLKLMDGEELLGLDHFEVKDCIINTKTNDIILSFVDLQGIRASAVKEANGDLLACHMRVKAKKPVAKDPAAMTSRETKKNTETKKAAPSKKTQKGEKQDTAKAEDAPKPKVQLKLLKVGKVDLAFRDKNNDVPLKVALKDLGLNFSNVVFDLDPESEPEKANFNVAWGLPGLVENMALEGSVTPSLTDPKLDLTLTGRGIEPKALEKVLEKEGITSLLKDASLKIRVRAGANLEKSRVRANAYVDEIVLKNQGEILLLLEDMKVEGVDLQLKNDKPSKVNVDLVQLGSFKTAVDLRKEFLEAVGFRLSTKKKEPMPGPNAKDAVAKAPGKVTTPKAEPKKAPKKSKIKSSKAPEPEPKEPLPEITLKKFRINEIVLFVEDHVSGPALEMPVTLKVDMGPFVFKDDELNAPEKAPYKIELFLPKVAEKITLSGDLGVNLTKVDLKANLNIVGITAEALRTRLEAANVKPMLKSGTLNIDLESHLELNGGDLAATVDMKNASFKDGELEYWGWDSIRVERFALKENNIALELLRIARPRVKATRNKDGSMLVSGFLITPKKEPVEKGKTETGKEGVKKESESKGEESPKSPKSDEKKAIVDKANETKEMPEPMETAPPTLIYVKKLSIDKVGVDWKDEVPEESVALNAELDVTVDDFVFGKKANPAGLDIRLRLKDVFEELSLIGSVDPDPADLHLRLDMNLSKLRAGPVKGYLPPDFKIALNEGKLLSHIEADFVPTNSGGFSARALLSKVKFSDGPKEHLNIDSILLNAKDVDLAADKVLVNEVSVKGVKTELTQSKDGLLKLLGLELGKKKAIPAKGEKELKDEGLPVKPETPVKETADKVLADTVKAKPKKKTGPRKKQVLPYIQVEKFEVSIDEVKINKEEEDKTQVFTLSKLRLLNEDLVEVFGRKPEDCRPIKLRLKASVAPFFRSLDLGMTIVPGALDPELSARLSIEGLDGEKLKPFLPKAPADPELAKKQAQIEEIELKDGRVTMSLDVLLRLGRRDATNFAVTKNFGAEVILSKIGLKDGPKGVDLGGIDKVIIDVSKINPKTSDVVVRQIEVIKPRALIKIDNDKKVLQAFGLRIQLPKPEKKAPVEEDEDEEDKDTEEDKEGEDEADKAPKVIVKKDPNEKTTTKIKTPEFRIDRLLLSSIDIKVLDPTTTPPMVFPFNNIDLVVYDVTTRALEEKRRIRYELNMAIGKAPLLKRPESNKIPGFDMVSDFFKGVTEATGLTKEDIEVEERKVLEELSIKGNIALFPSPVVFTTIEVSAFDLLSLTGVALESGVSIKDGLLDAKIIINLKEDRSLNADILIKFENVEVNEGDEGPIRKYLKLKFPTTVVTFLLRDEEGVIKIPWELDLPQGNISIANIQKSLILLFARLIGEATGKAVFRALGTVGDLGSLTLGNIPGLDKIPGADFVPFLGGGKQEPEKIYLNYEPAELELNPENYAALKEIAGRLNKNEQLRVVLVHELGTDDRERLVETANPSAEDCIGLIARFGQRRSELMERRSDLKTNILAAYSAGLNGEAGRLRRELMSLHNELGEIDKRVSDLTELLTPRARRGSERRIQQGAKTLGKMRLEWIYDQLKNLGVKNPKKRVRLGRVRYEEPEIKGGRILLVLSRQRT